MEQFLHQEMGACCPPPRPCRALSSGRMKDPSTILAGEIPGDGGESPWVRPAFLVGPCFLLGPRAVVLETAGAGWLCSRGYQGVRRATRKKPQVGLWGRSLGVAPTLIDRKVTLLPIRHLLPIGAGPVVHMRRIRRYHTSPPLVSPRVRYKGRAASGEGRESPKPCDSADSSRRHGAPLSRERPPKMIIYWRRPRLSLFC